NGGISSEFRIRYLVFYCYCKKDNDDVIDRYGFFGGVHKLSDESLKKIRLKEIKWQTMLTEWDKWMSFKANKVRNRCRKGIPPAIRPRAWQYLCGSYHLFNQEYGKYQVKVCVGRGSNLGPCAWSARVLTAVPPMQSDCDQYLPKPFS
ncbi:unnamed protein product, partial [Trichobilharzia regenti]